MTTDNATISFRIKRGKYSNLIRDIEETINHEAETEYNLHHYQVVPLFPQTSFYIDIENEKTMANFGGVDKCLLQSNKLSECIPIENDKKQAVVSGKSITGMMAALILWKHGYCIHIYDKRSSYTRNIQWAARQSLIDMLHYIDPELADKFKNDIAKPLKNGTYRLFPDGTRKVSQRQEIKTGDHNRIPQTGKIMMTEKAIMTMEAKRFEQFLKEYLDTIPEIEQHIGVIKVLNQDEEGNYKILGHGTPDLIVIAEGSESATRSELGIKSVPTSDGRVQIAAMINYEAGGKMVKHLRYENDKYRLTGTMSTLMSNKTWIVADVDSAKITPPVNTDPKNFNDIKQNLIRNEVKRLIIGALEINESKINNCEIWGAIEGQNCIQDFILQQRISSAATSGSNVILVGDAVGNNHWSVGGGMQVGAVAHMERLRKLLKTDLGNIDDKKKKLQEYSKGAIDDTMAWGEAGIQDFYQNVESCKIKEMYYDSIQDWIDKKSKTPLEAIKVKLENYNIVKS